MQRNATSEVDPVDRQRGEIGVVGRNGPVDPALLIEAKIERDAVDGEFGGAPFAAHQRAETELDGKIIGTDTSRIVGAADDDRLKTQRWCRQQPRVKRSAPPASWW